MTTHRRPRSENTTPPCSAGCSASPRRRSRSSRRPRSSPRTVSRANARREKTHGRCSPHGQPGDVTISVARCPPMRAYLIRRAVLMVPVFWGVTLFVFLAIRIVPGDVIMSQMTEGGVVDPALREQLTRELGLDVPVHEQYLRWIARVVHGDLGLSLVSRTPVANEITRRVPISAELAAIAVIIALLIAIPFGIAATLSSATWIGHRVRC